MTRLGDLFVPAVWVFKRVATILVASLVKM
ncbi:hypothetical protein AF72_01330 [Xylella taiwanensis]|uniref:Uncharacterized protein n=1 Tax=Xylella taiwanensis TaxID=1444770 RepID=Z9JML6_9GAMM|nr:hypothetical protein AF72_01330 [Xylella taiwanensis]